MEKLWYCLKCRRIFKNAGECIYCKSTFTKELNRNSPVNVFGTKIKGKVLKIEDGKAKLLIINENKEKYIKEYDVDKLRKIL
ncbi:MAG: hypothetical protein GX895_01600 [Clostridiales bacterium]|uniref:hypothetical protein n=1 Tax=Clostridium sp. N3C TaxID=1776758 RepID=UPI00092DF0BA|nr:hypothetical protein [Clostridium sp. N3C]NLZ47477.1 hypothetical protein [Clostridiales bacterium]SCN21858.1 hypothetical protein N3C_0467 [Clostridium sp. N3C]